MNSTLTKFYKFAEHHPVDWNKSMTMFCNNTECGECTLYLECKTSESLQLTSIDIRFIKQNNPEYFI